MAIKEPRDDRAPRGNGASGTLTELAGMADRFDAVTLDLDKTLLNQLVLVTWKYAPREDGMASRNFVHRSDQLLKAPGWLLRHRRLLRILCWEVRKAHQTLVNRDCLGGLGPPRSTDG